MIGVVKRILQAVNVVQRQPADVDEVGGLLDLELHQIEQMWVVPPLMSFAPALDTAPIVALGSIAPVSEWLIEELLPRHRG